MDEFQSLQVISMLVVDTVQLAQTSNLLAVVMIVETLRA